MPLRVVIVFCRVPGAEPVKTRLAETLGRACAAEIYQACLHDVLESALDVEARLVLCFSPPEAAEALRRWLQQELGDVEEQRGIAVWPQCGGDLGGRMAGALQTAFRSGATEVALVGSDIPGLAAAHIEAALAAAQQHDLVFGPAVDGGFYLLAGSSRARPDIVSPTVECRPPESPVAFTTLLSGIRWSRPDTLQQILDRTGEMRLRVALLVPRPDLDTAADLPVVLQMLQAEGASGRGAGGRVLATIEALAGRTQV